MNKNIFIPLICILSACSAVYANESEREVPAVLKDVPVITEQPLINSHVLPELKKETPIMEGKVQTLDGEAPVKIRPSSKISTSNPLLKEGDYVEFEVAEEVVISDDFTLNKGEKAIGLITKLEDNAFNGEPASIVVDQFVITRDTGVKFYLRGEVEKKGQSHNSAVVGYNYILGPAAFWIRGGEIHFNPDKDIYNVRLHNLRQVEKL